MFSLGFYYRENSAVVTLGHELVMRQYGVYSMLPVSVLWWSVQSSCSWCAAENQTEISPLFLVVSTNFPFPVLSSNHCFCEHCCHPHIQTSLITWELLFVWYGWKYTWNISAAALHKKKKTQPAQRIRAWTPAALGCKRTVKLTMVFLH